MLVLREKVGLRSLMIEVRRGGGCQDFDNASEGLVLALFCGEEN